MSDPDARTFGPLVRAGILVGSFPVVIGGLAAAGGGFSLPSMFVGLALIALALALAAVWQSLRTALGGGPEIGIGLNAGFAEREVLLAEKETLLTTIKDITFDHEVGKLDDEDFERMNRTYRSRAKEVLRQLDQDLGPYLDEASKLIDGAMGTKGRKVGRDKAGQGKAGQGKAGKGKAGKGKAVRSKNLAPDAEKRQLECGSCGADNDYDALHCDQCGGRLGAAVCPSCETENDPDAKFCKQCATALVAASQPKKKSSKKKSKSKRRRSAPVAEASSADDAPDAADDSADEASEADGEVDAGEAADDEAADDESDADESDNDDEPDESDANETDAGDAQQEARP